MGQRICSRRRADALLAASWLLIIHPNTLQGLRRLTRPGLTMVDGCGMLSQRTVARIAPNAHACVNTCRGPGRAGKNNATNGEMISLIMHTCMHGVTVQGRPTVQRMSQANMTHECGGMNGWGALPQHHLAGCVEGKEACMALAPEAASTGKT